MQNETPSSLSSEARLREAARILATGAIRAAAKSVSRAEATDQDSEEEVSDEG